MFEIYLFLTWMLVALVEYSLVILHSALVVIEQYTSDVV